MKYIRKNKKIFLHIGIGKTGTSAIQKALYDNKEKLSACGVLVPYSGLSKNRIGHHELAKLNVQSPDEVTRKVWESLLNEIENDSSNCIIISSENFSYCHNNYIDYIGKILKDYDVKILFYVRKQDKLIESAYLLWLAEGYNYFGSFTEFYEKTWRAFDFNLRIKPWVNNFGEKNIIVKMYDKKVINYDIVSHFFTAIGFKNCDISKDSKQLVNNSILPDFVNLIRLIDEAQNNIKNREKIINEIRNLSINFIQCSNLELVDKKLKSRIKNDFCNSNKEFSEKFLNSEESKIFCEFND